MRNALLDACVLYPAALRDLWMHLAVRRVFQPRWTPRIQEERIRSVLANRPDLQPAQLARTRACMEAWAGDWEVPDPTPYLADLELPDPDDVHVLAAAVAGRVPTLVTFNRMHFPAAALAPYGITAVAPDIFAAELLDADPGGFRRAVHTHRAALRHPPKSVPEYLDTLHRVGLVQTAAQLALTPTEL